MLQTIVSGLESGSWFALLGLAIVVVMKAADVPNFAMAEMGLVATYVGISVAGAGARQPVRGEGAPTCTCAPVEAPATGPRNARNGMPSARR